MASAVPPSGPARLKNGMTPSDDRPPMGAKTRPFCSSGDSTFSTGAKLSPEFFSPME